MLDLKLLQKQPELIAEALKKRNSAIKMEEFEAIDGKRRSLLAENEALKSDKNKISAEIAQIKRSGGDAAALMQKSTELGERIKDLDAALMGVKTEMDDWMLNIPNIPHESVPYGTDENDNIELHRWGQIPQFDFTPKEHWEIGAELDGLDFERGSRLAGSRFTVLKGWAARLERALINFFLDIQTTEHGYKEMLPPQIVNRNALIGTGQLPKFAEDLFHLENWEYFLIPTAEVPLTNMHAGEMLEEDQLPIAYAAQTACFRSEAGSAGKDTRGLIRQHQFTKVEMVRFSHPDNSFEELERMRAHAEALLQRLELPYRTITLCTGDMGFGSAKTYDIEVWLPGQNTYREISSCSNCVDFQARRANIRFKPKAGGKPAFVHTLNGSGLPIGRTIVAIIENGQQADGSFRIPKALQPYMGGLEVIKK